MGRGHRLKKVLRFVLLGCESHPKWMNIMCNLIGSLLSIFSNWSWICLMGSCSLMWKQCNKKPHYITLKWRYHYITLQLTLHCLMLKVSINDFNIHYSAYCVWLNWLSVNITLFDFVSEGAPGRLIQSPNIGWKTKISTGIKEKDSVLAELRI